MHKKDKGRMVNASLFCGNGSNFRNSLDSFILTLLIYGEDRSRIMNRQIIVGILGTRKVWRYYEREIIQIYAGPVWK